MSNIIKLPLSQKDLIFPLMKALAERRTVRKWQHVSLSNQELSNLLWAACGINREKKNCKNKRTAPSACNWQEIKLYLALDSGLYLYNEKVHQLVSISTIDIRDQIGTQKMMRSAPVGLIFVSDYSKMNGPMANNDERRWFCSAVDSGFISQNIYLYCAAAGLNTVVLGLVDRNKLHQLMGLKEHEKVVLTQVVGRPLKT